MASMLRYFFTRIKKRERLTPVSLSDRKEYLKKQICSWDFLPLDLDNKDLIQVVFTILDHTLMSFDELEALRVPNGKVAQKISTWTP